MGCQVECNQAVGYWCRHRGCGIDMKGFQCPAETF
jgi:hypothetical protein